MDAIFGFDDEQGGEIYYPGIGGIDFDDDDEYGGEIYAMGGPSDEEIVEALMSGGPEDDEIMQMIHAMGGPFMTDAEVGGWFSKLKKRFKKVGRSLGRGLGLVKKRKRVNPTVGTSIKGSATASMANRNASTGIAGARFIMEKGCTLVTPPITAEARVPVVAARQAMLQGALQQPEVPYVGNVTVSGVSYATISPLQKLGVAGMELSDKKKIAPFALKIDIGLPGVGAASGVPVVFDVYTSSWTGDGTTDIGATPAPEPNPLAGSFSSGQFTVTPHSVASALSLVIIPWQVVQAIPQPKLLDFSVTQITEGTPDTYRYRGLVLRISSAPANSSAAITMITPTHPEYQALASLLGA